MEPFKIFVAGHYLNYNYWKLATRQTPVLGIETEIGNRELLFMRLEREVALDADKIRYEERTKVKKEKRVEHKNQLQKNKCPPHEPGQTKFQDLFEEFLIKVAENTRTEFPEVSKNNYYKYLSPGIKKFEKKKRKSSDKLGDEDSENHVTHSKKRKYIQPLGTALRNSGNFYKS